MLLSGETRRRKLQTVAKLNLSQNRLTQYTADLALIMPSLQVLDLRANKLEEISSMIKDITQLRVLKLDKNELTRLPEEVYELGALQELTFQ